MIIEGGSQNASRMAGHYAYPAPRYNPTGIEAIAPIRGRSVAAGTPVPGAPSTVDRLEAQNRLEARRNVAGAYQRSRPEVDTTPLNLYQDPGSARAGGRNTAPPVVTGMNLDLMA